MMDLGRMRALATLEQFGSVNAAATALHCTPSAISQQLAKLEREAGTQLYEKDGRGLRLTDAGRILAEQARAVLERMEQAEAALAAHHNTVGGRLTIAAFATACRGLLPVVLADLGAEHPQLVTALHEINPYEAIAELTRGQTDLAVVHDWTEVRLQIPENVHQYELGLDHADLVVPARHRLAGAGPVGVAQLRDERWIAAPPGAICHDWLIEVLPGVRADYLLGEFESQLALVAAGIGVALIPRMARTQLPDGTLAVPLEPIPTRRVLVLWRASSASRPAIRVGVQALRNAWRAMTVSREAPPVPAPR